ncbi:MAG: D-amino-acid transaminase [Opitutales bacterium]|nr:D-amino-acid transaminase [Opitutales bacterium]
MNWILRNEGIVPRAQARVDIDDRGHQFGDGIYEVIRVYGGTAFLMQPHLDRLRRSAREIGMVLPWNDDALAARGEELMARESMSDGILYFQVTRGVCPRLQVFPPEDVTPQITAYARPMPRPCGEADEGLHAHLVPDIRWLRCDIKSINLLPNMLARQKAKEHGCAEALQHRDGIVTEGAFSNAYIVAGGTVHTHPADNRILAGITRVHILGLCAAAGIPVREEPFRVEDLRGADEIFISSTASEVAPVIRLDGQPVAAGKPGPLTRRLQAAFRETLPAD